MKKLSLLLLCSLGLSFSAQMASAQSAPQGVQILRVNAMGNGCRPGTVRSVISPDNQDLSVLFDSFITQSGGTEARAVDRKVCMINMRLAIPSGWSMALISADYRGFAGIEQGAVATHEALYSLNRDYEGSSFSSWVVRGPINDVYIHHSEMSADLVDWSECGVNQVDLNVRVSLLAQSPMTQGRKPQAMLTIDSMDTSTRQSFTLAWKPCTGGGNRPNNGHNGGRPRRPPGRFNAATVDHQMSDGRRSAFRLYRNQNDLDGLTALHSCIDVSVNRQFVSTDPRCEGQRYDRPLGFVSRYPQPDTVPLVEYVNPRDYRDRIFTTRADEAAGYRANRTIGFVVQTR